MGEWPCGKFFLTMARLRPCSKSRAITNWCTICVPVDRKAWLIAKRTFRVSDPRSNRANTSGGCRRLFEGRFLRKAWQGEGKRPRYVYLIISREITVLPSIADGQEVPSLVLVLVQPVTPSIMVVYVQAMGRVGLGDRAVVIDG